MNLIGKRVLLRELRESDMELLNSLMNDSEINSNIIGWSKPVTMSDQITWFKSLNNDQNVRYAITDKDSEVVCGTGIISRIDWKNSNCSIDIKLDPNCQNKGYGTETIKLLVKYAFDELNMNTIIVKILDYNLASQKIFEKNGFKKAGVLRKNVFKKGKYNDIYIYDITKEDYLNERNW